MIPLKPRDTEELDMDQKHIERGAYESRDLKLTSVSHLMERRGREGCSVGITHKFHPSCCWRALPITFCLPPGVDSTTPLALHAMGYARALRR